MYTPLQEVKDGLGVTGSYQDATLTVYVEEVESFLISGGVKPGNITPGIVVRGVADLWNYGGAEGKLSEYFLQRAAQLALM